MRTRPTLSGSACRLAGTAAKPSKPGRHVGAGQRSRWHPPPSSRAPLPRSGRWCLPAEPVSRDPRTTSPSCRSPPRLGGLPDPSRDPGPRDRARHRSSRGLTHRQKPGLYGGSRRLLRSPGYRAPWGPLRLSSGARMAALSVAWSLAQVLKCCDPQLCLLAGRWARPPPHQARVAQRHRWRGRKPSSSELSAILFGFSFSSCCEPDLDQSGSCSQRSGLRLSVCPTSLGYSVAPGW